MADRDAVLQDACEFKADIAKPSRPDCAVCKIRPATSEAMVYSLPQDGLNWGIQVPICEPCKAEIRCADCGEFDMTAGDGETFCQTCRVVGAA